MLNVDLEKLLEQELEKLNEKETRWNELKTKLREKESEVNEQWEKVVKIKKKKEQNESAMNAKSFNIKLIVSFIVGALICVFACGIPLIFMSTHYIMSIIFFSIDSIFLILLQNENNIVSKKFKKFLKKIVKWAHERSSKYKELKILNKKLINAYERENRLCIKLKKELRNFYKYNDYLIEQLSEQESIVNYLRNKINPVKTTFNKKRDLKLRKTVK